MKKLLLVSLSIIALAISAQAKKADRGDLDGVTADDLRAKAPATQTAQPQAPQGATVTVEVQEAVVVAEAQPAQAACPAKAANCPAAAACPANPEACSTCEMQVLPILQGKEFAPKAYTTQFGQNWAAIGGGINILKGFPQGGQKLGANAIIEGSINVLSACDDTYGLNLVVPLTFNYISASSTSDAYGFQFPVYARPYYRFNVSEDVVITPYGDFGVGGAFGYTSEEASSEKTLAFVWAVGAGVEISFYKDFSFTPKYSWFNAQDGGTEYKQVAGGEFAWRFASNMTAVAEYSYSFFKEANARDHAVTVKVRYEF